jgi:transcriptional regulator with XRE-family HTH domain
MDVWASIAAQARAARKAAGLSQAELAERIGTSISAISRLESSRGRPTVRTLSRIAQETGAVFSIGPSRSEPATPGATVDPALTAAPAEDGSGAG